MDAVNKPTYAELKTAFISGEITDRQADIFLALGQKKNLYLTKGSYQFNNLMLGKEIPSIYEELKLKAQRMVHINKGYLPNNITKDWYLREPGSSNEKVKMESQKVIELKIIVYARNARIFRVMPLELMQKGPF